MEPITISSTLLATLSTLAVGANIKITGDDDILDLGYMFYDWVQKQNDMTWDAVTTAFNACVALNPNNLVSVESDFLNIVKGFFDDTFDDNKVQGGYIGFVGGLPYYGDRVYLNTTDELGVPFNFKSVASDGEDYFPIGDFLIGYGGTNSYSELWIKVKTTNPDIINKNLPNTFESFFIHKDRIDRSNCFLSVCYHNTTYNYVLVLQSYDTGTLYTTGLSTFNCDSVISFPYDGGYDWGDVSDNTDEDGTVAIPVPGYTGDLVGDIDDVGIWDKPGTLTDGKVQNPAIDHPWVNVTDDTFPGAIPGTDTGGNIPTAPIIPPVIPDAPDINEGTDGELGEGTNDNLGSNISNVAGGLYYYYIGTDVADSSIDDVIGHATGVVSLSYTPYLWYGDCNITKLPYDSERFNNLLTLNNFSVYRVNDVTRPVKKVGGFLRYNTLSLNIGEGAPYNYMNETKLYQYPYSFAYLYDGINNPLEIKYHYLQYDYNDVYIKQTVSDKCTYSIFVKNYKGDNEGNLEAMVLTSGNELPCSSSTYAQWFATNRNQLAQNIQNIQNTNAIQNHGNIQQFEISQQSNMINGIGNLIGAIGSVFSLDFGNAVSGVASGLNTVNVMRSQQAQLNTNLALNKQSEQNAIQSALALNSDMRNSPSTLVSHGSNVFYGLVNNNKKLLLIRMGLNEEDYFRLGTYFTMYGYKQNKILDINLRNRKYFNYFKIVSPNIVSSNVPAVYLEEIKKIFKEGITLWHYENSNKILDYFHSDNYEV